MPARLHSIAPFFIVDSLQPSLDFYNNQLGFRTVYTGGGEDASRDFFGAVKRDGVTILLKAITPGVHPQPNRTRHEWARWDAYVDTPDPDALYAEYVAQGVPMHAPLGNTGDGLRAFEVLDNSGYVICFGRPLERPA